jgi:hypothetical protein
MRRRSGRHTSAWWPRAPAIPVLGSERAVRIEGAVDALAVGRAALPALLEDLLRPAVA